MFPKAARMLGAPVDTVAASVRSLCYVLVGAATSGRNAEDLLQGTNLTLPPPLKESLVSFYKDIAPELEQEVRTGLDLPRYKGLEWRLQVCFGGRYMPRQAPQSSVLMRLHTTGGSASSKVGEHHLLQADLPNLRRLVLRSNGLASEHLHLDPDTLPRLTEVRMPRPPASRARARAPPRVASPLTNAPGARPRSSTSPATSS